MDFGVLVIIPIAFVIVFIIRILIDRKYKNIELPDIREAQDKIFDPENNMYTFKTIFEVPGCGSFDSYNDADIGRRKCALSKLKENRK